MKAAIIATVILCLGLIGIGYYFAIHEDSGPRVVPIDAVYAERIKNEGWVKGPASPKVKLVEYGDFQCPACHYMYPIISESIDQTKDIAQFTFKNYPLPMHDKSTIAAMAAEAAGMQGKFWQMYDELYSRQDEWSALAPGTFQSTTLEEYAKTIQLNADQFKKDLKASTTREQIDKDKIAGDKVPVEGTPTILINGKKIDPLPRTTEEMVKAIRDAAQNAGS